MISLRKEKKKNSVSISRVPFHNYLSAIMAPAIYLVCRSPRNSSILPSIVLTVGRVTLNDGIRELAAPSWHSPMITHRLVVSYTTFSPLPPRRMAVILFYRYLLSPIASTFGSRAPYAARTFLSPPKEGQRQSRDAVFNLQR